LFDDFKLEYPKEFDDFEKISHYCDPNDEFNKYYEYVCNLPYIEAKEKIKKIIQFVKYQKEKGKEDNKILKTKYQFIWVTKHNDRRIKKNYTKIYNKLGFINTLEKPKYLIKFEIPLDNDLFLPTIFDAYDISNFTKLSLYRPKQRKCDKFGETVDSNNYKPGIDEALISSVPLNNKIDYTIGELNVDEKDIDYKVFLQESINDIINNW